MERIISGNNNDLPSSLLSCQVLCMSICKYGKKKKEDKEGRELKKEIIIYIFIPFWYNIDIIILTDPGCIYGSIWQVAGPGGNTRHQAKQRFTCICI